MFYAPLLVFALACAQCHQQTHPSPCPHVINRCRTMDHAKQYAEFITFTCLNWQPVLSDDHIKHIIMQSLLNLTTRRRIRVFAFVIMSNHMHVIWQMLGDHQRENVQRDFLKYTGQQILRVLREGSSPLLKDLAVNAEDRKYQVWERNSLAIPLWSDTVIWQKVAYIHDNPVKAGLCLQSGDYVYSSAGFYLRKVNRWGFLSHVDG